MIYKTEFILLFILNMLDALSTIYFLEFNIFSEGNPIVAYLIYQFGYIGAFAVSKLTVLGFFAWLLIKHKDELLESKLAQYGMRLMVIVYLAVVINNIGGIAAFHAGVI